MRQEYYCEKIWRLPHTYLAVAGFEAGGADAAGAIAWIFPLRRLVFLDRAGWPQTPPCYGNQVADANSGTRCPTAIC
jgi:hypothetical protein